MHILRKSFVIAATALCFTLGLVMMAPIIIVGAVDGTWKMARE